MNSPGILQSGDLIAATGSLQAGECYEFYCAQGPAFLVRHTEGWKAYLNNCPHIGLQLNWKPGEFFASDGKLLICSGHGALFRPEDGLCISGPCNGQHLQTVAIEMREGSIYLR